MLYRVCAGVIRKTSVGTEVAVFTFNSIYLGPEVEVTVVGQRAFSLISKTSAVINTTFYAAPGTLGGFQGGASVARLQSDMLSDSPRDIYICDLGGYCAYNTSDPSSQRVFYEALVSNNVNGPGSGNLRINSFIIRTSASHIPEIQSITTTASKGQTLAGGFTLQFKQFTTPIIPHDASALQLKQIIEENLNLVNPNSLPVFPARDAASAGVGIVSVSRSPPDTTEGFTWTVTFNSAIGNIEQLRSQSFLIAGGASISTHTVRNGNELGGTYRLKFQGAETEPILAAETAVGLQRKLLRLPMVRTAFVDRIDPTNNCDDGLCPNGPYPARGLMWSIYVTTDAEYDNISPTSPSSPIALTNAPPYNFTADFSALTGTDAAIEVIASTAESPYYPQNLLTIPFPFSLAWGGAGGSYGGQGGAGYGMNPVGPLYNDREMTDLLGGSGGALANGDPFQINAAFGPTIGRGGNGGGAFEFIAANDLTIGSFGQIYAKGGEGEQSSGGGGGGGSGGAIVLASGT
ncbi:hypothetical protein EON65_30950, partial [archaeon]